MDIEAYAWAYNFHYVTLEFTNVIFWDAMEPAEIPFRRMRIHI